MNSFQMTSPDSHVIPNALLSSQSNDNDTVKFTHHEMVLLSPEIELGLHNVLEAKSSLDTNQVKAVEYLNSVFPNGKS